MSNKHFKIVLVGEAPGKQEEIYGKPFVGAAGEELNRLLIDSGIMPGIARNPFEERAEHVAILNVFSKRPPADDNSILSICVKRKDLPNKGVGYSLPALSDGYYVRPEFLPELDRLKAELEELKPNIVVALGNTALWALTQCVGLEKYRGAIMESTLVPGQKMLATFHPASLFRVWNRRSVLVLDLIKAREESERPDISRRKREVWMEPTLSDLDRFYEEHLKGADLIAFDIENPRDIISCISFAPSPDIAIVVPFEDERKPGNSYWPTRAEEIAAWRWVAKVLRKSKGLLAQNGVYDCGHLEQALCPVSNFEHDTMLLSHSLMPEERKGLGHLGSLWANESPWKQSADFRGDKTIKRDA